MFATEAEQVFGEPAENIKKYLSKSKKAYKNIGELFLDFPLNLSLNLPSHPPLNLPLNSLLNSRLNPPKK